MFTQGKYITGKLPGESLACAIVFSEVIDHARMANLVFRDVENVISAGFFHVSINAEHDIGVSVHGKSVSTKKTADLERDPQLIKQALGLYY